MDSIGLLAALGGSATTGAKLTKIAAFNVTNNEITVSIGTFKYAILCITTCYNKDVTVKCPVPVNNTIIIGPNLSSVIVHAWAFQASNAASSEAGRLRTTSDSVTFIVGSNCMLSGTITAFN